MQRNFGPPDDFLDHLKRVPGPVSLFVGSNDEVFRADQYAPLLKPVRPDLEVTIGLGHMDMTVKEPALAALASAV